MMFYGKEVRAELGRTTGMTTAERLAIRPAIIVDALADERWRSIGEWSIETPTAPNAWGLTGGRSVRRFRTWSEALEAGGPSSVVKYRDHVAEFACSDPLAVAKIARFANERAGVEARNAAHRRHVPGWLRAKRKAARRTVRGE